MTYKALKHLFLILPLHILICCGAETKDPLPESILKEDKMTSLLLDMHLYEGLVYRQHKLPEDSMYKLQAYFRKAICLRHGVEDSVYSMSLTYYEAHPRRYLRIYERLMDSLNRRLAIKKR